MSESINSQLFGKIVAVRRDLHRYPELSWSENRTAQAICDFLKHEGISYRANVAETGVVAEIPGPPNIPYVLLRADTDALPIEEETGLEFSSTHKGVMHACGHDGHTAMVLGAAQLLSRESALPAPIRLVFQPAEEKGTGALAMIREGVLDQAGMIFGGHLDRHCKAGSIIVSEGPVNASSDMFRIEITGQGAHGARPHESIDAVIVGSLMIIALQTIVSREVDPAFPSVVSVGSFQAGTASNVIAGHAVLEGTIRAQHQHVREHLQTAIQRIAESIGQLHGAKIKVTITQGTPPVINSQEMTLLIREAARQAVGFENIFPLRTANMGGEDFSYYLEKIPGAYVRFGGQVPGRENYPAHSSKFDFDEQALAIGANFFYQVALLAGEILHQQKRA